MEAALITGSRSWSDAAVINGIVRRYEFIVVGDAKGADHLAAVSARAHDCMLKVFPADWDKHGAGAGIIRNSAMVAFCKLLPADGILVHCHAFWDGQSGGTRYCARSAEAAGIATSWHLAA